MHIKIFMEIDSDIRLIRRIQRDTVERGRSILSVIQQYLGSVKEMHAKYVEPTKKNANVVIKEYMNNKTIIDLLSKKISKMANNV